MESLDVNTELYGQETQSSTSLLNRENRDKTVHVETQQVPCKNKKVIDTECRNRIRAQKWGKFACSDIAMPGSLIILRVLICESIVDAES